MYVIDMKAPFHEANAVWSPDAKWFAFTKAARPNPVFMNGTYFPSLDQSEAI